MFNSYIDMDLLLQVLVGNYRFAKEIMNVSPSVPAHSGGVFLKSPGKTNEDTWNHKLRLPKAEVSYTMVSSRKTELYSGAQRGVNLSLAPAASAEANGSWERRARTGCFPWERGTGKKILTSLWKLSSFRRSEVSAVALAKRAQISHSLRKPINSSRY